MRTGTFHQLDELRQKVPAGVRSMMAIPTLGPKRALVLHGELGVASIEELADAIDAGRLMLLRGFGPGTAQTRVRRPSSHPNGWRSVHEITHRDGWP